MTLSTTETNQQFVGDGVITIFSWTFKTLAITDMEVYLAGEIQLTGFTLQLNGDQDSNPGGTCTFSVAPGDLVNVNLVRAVVKTQLTDYQPFDAFPAETHETALDRVTMQTQELDELLNRSTVPPPDAEPGDSFVDGNLTVTGSGKFGENTEVTEAAPIEDEHLTRKDYVDEQDLAVSKAIFDAKLAGYEDDGLHSQFTGDLDTINNNSAFSILGGNVTNEPSDFASDGWGVLTTDINQSGDTLSVQTLVGISSGNANKQWMRWEASGIWQPWILIIDGRAGSGSTTVSDTPPPDPLDGDGWWDTIGGKPYIFYDDGDSSQWVEEVPGIVPAPEPEPEPEPEPKIIAMGESNSGGTSLRFSFGFSGVSLLGTGRYRYTFTDPQPDTEYVVSGLAAGSSLYVSWTTLSTTHFDIQTNVSTGVATSVLHSVTVTRIKS